MWSIPRTLSKFWVLAHFKLSYLLESKKYGFWLDFGCQVEVQNRSSWPQEGLGGFLRRFLRPLNFELKKHRKNSFFGPPKKRVGGMVAQPLALW